MSEIIVWGETLCIGDDRIIGGENFRIADADEHHVLLKQRYGTQIICRPWRKATKADGETAYGHFAAEFAKNRQNGPLHRF